MYPLTTTAPSFNLETLTTHSSIIFNTITCADMETHDDDGNLIDTSPETYYPPCLYDDGTPLYYM